MTSHPKSQSIFRSLFPKNSIITKVFRHLVWTRYDMTAWQALLPLGKGHHFPSMSVPHKTHMSENEHIFFLIISDSCVCRSVRLYPIVKFLISMSFSEWRKEIYSRIKARILENTLRRRQTHLFKNVIGTSTYLCTAQETKPHATWCHMCKCFYKSRYLLSIVEREHANDCLKQTFHLVF